MKLFELLETAKLTGDIIKNDKYKLGIAYSVKCNCFVWCDINGKAIESSNDYTGYQRVVLSLKLLEREDWYLVPKNKDSNMDYAKDKTYITKNGLVIDNESMCNLFKRDEFGNYSIIEINKKEGTIINKGNILICDKF